MWRSAGGSSLLMSPCSLVPTSSTQRNSLDQGSQIGRTNVIDVAQGSMTRCAILCCHTTINAVESSNRLSNTIPMRTPRGSLSKGEAQGLDPAGHRRAQGKARCHALNPHGALQRYPRGWTKGHLLYCTWPTGSERPQGWGTRHTEATGSRSDSVGARIMVCRII